MMVQHTLNPEGLQDQDFSASQGTWRRHDDVIRVIGINCSGSARLSCAMKLCLVCRRYTGINCALSMLSIIISKNLWLFQRSSELSTVKTQKGYVISLEPVLGVILEEWVPEASQGSSSSPWFSLSLCRDAAPWRQDNTFSNQPFTAQFIQIMQLALLTGCI